MTRAVPDLELRRGHVLVVGVGDDGPAGLPPRTLAAIRQADVLVGGRRHLAQFGDVVAERWPVGSDVRALIRRIGTEAADRRTVVLASGDPCFFGIGPLLADALGRARVTIVPGVTAVALAFARLGLAWQDATVVSAHGRPLDDAIRAARGAAKLAVLTDPENTPSAVARALLAAGADDGGAWVFEHLGGPAEREIETSLGSLAQPGGRDVAALNVLIVPSLSWVDLAPPAAEESGEEMRAGSPAPEPSSPAPEPRQSGPGDEVGPSRHFGRPESEYAHRDGMVTKPEVRAVSLSKLRLRAGQVLWDVGAGSGSLAVEAAGLVDRLTVFAVERSESQIPLLRLNVGRQRVGESVQVVYGEAPAVLRDLPAPDAVFVGGSGGRLAEILDLAAERVRPGGRIVVNLVTVEGIAAALHWARARDVGAEVVQVSVARGSEIVGMTRLQAENPVTIVTLTP